MNDFHFIKAQRPTVQALDDTAGEKITGIIRLQRNEKKRNIKELKGFVGRKKKLLIIYFIKALS